MYRNFFELHYVPHEWRLSYITPIFKKGSPSDPKYYRLIALTCTAYKIFESLISSEILDHLSAHHLITPHQHGFLRKHSTASNLLESILPSHAAILLMLLTLISVELLTPYLILLKLSAYGLSGNLFHWIKTFLTNRRQLVRINSFYSNICSITSGVLQGSVLGPLRFTIFINDIVDSLDDTTTAKLFADDLKLYTNISTSNSIDLQHQLEIILNWSKTWQLPISFSRCTILHLGQRKQQHQYEFQNSPIIANQTQSETLEFSLILNLTSLVIFILLSHALKFIPRK